MTLGEKFEKVADIVYDKGYEAFENYLRDCDSFQYFFADDRNNHLLELWKEDYTQNAVELKRMFNSSKDLVIAPRISANKCESCIYMFYNCSNLTTIPYLYVERYEINFVSAFRGCSKLESITFDGIIQNDIDFQYCPLLSVESMINIITHLVNTKGEEEEYRWTLTFTDECWERLEESGKPCDSGLTDDATMTWQNYVTEVLCWNI